MNIIVDSAKFYLKHSYFRGERWFVSFLQFAFFGLFLVICGYRKFIFTFHDVILQDIKHSNKCNRNMSEVYVSRITASADKDFL